MSSPLTSVHIDIDNALYRSINYTNSVIIISYNIFFYVNKRLLYTHEYDIVYFSSLDNNP